LRRLGLLHLRRDFIGKVRRLRLLGWLFLCLTAAAIGADALHMLAKAKWHVLTLADYWTAWSARGGASAGPTLASVWLKVPMFAVPLLIALVCFLLARQKRRATTSWSRRRAPARRR
jgi:hypothetical protein